MRFAIDSAGVTPVYLQLEDQIRYAVSVGDLEPGDRLPSIRDLEAELRINRNTVRRAYLDLEREGTLIVRQGRVPEVAAASARGGAPPRAAPAKVARSLLRDLESKGLDVLSFASVFSAAAAAHDARYPKGAFVECSQDQADDFARAASAAWRRRVIGVDLSRLRKRPAAIPPSVRHVLTTRWHLAEVRKLLRRRPATVREATVRLSLDAREGIERLAGRRVGLILRDPESFAGYTNWIGKLAKNGGPVRAALIENEQEALDLLSGSQAIVFTTPCREFVRRRAPAHLALQELLYQPAPDSLERIGKEIFGETKGHCDDGTVPSHVGGPVAESAQQRRFRGAARKRRLHPGLEARSGRPERRR
jgi:GntR family transcriptional regulator